MTRTLDLHFYYNFRSPYCYLASKTVWGVFDDFHVNLLWRPLGGWSGRSDPERAKVKIPLVRQDIKRWCRKLAIPFNPPPFTTDPTRAGAASLLAEREGRLRDFVIAVMHAEWGEGRDIGEAEVLGEVAEQVGLDPDAVIAAADDPANRHKLAAHAELAEQNGIFGVPSFAVDQEIFWGNDRLDFLRDHLQELGLAKVQ